MQPKQRATCSEHRVSLEGRSVWGNCDVTQERKDGAGQGPGSLGEVSQVESERKEGREGNLT